LTNPWVFNRASFDVMTEMWFDDRSGFDAQLAAVRSSPVKERISHDESQFLQRDQQVLFVVNECVTAGAAAGSVGAKLIRFGRAVEGVGPDELRTRYERDTADVAAAVPGLVDYRRSYPDFGHPLSFAGGHHNASPPSRAEFPLDFVEELWLQDRSDVPAAYRALERAGSELIDSRGTRTALAQEFRSPWGRPVAPVVTRA
jgi:hypothetical protein